MRLRVQGPTGVKTTLTVAEDESFSTLKELIGAMLKIEDTSGITMLVGFPPAPLVAEDVTPIENVLKDGEVIVIKQTSINVPTTSNASTEVSRRRQQIHPKICPPGIDEETWENLDEETKRELSFNLYEENEDGAEDEMEEAEEDEEGGDLDVETRRLAELRQNMRGMFQQRSMEPSSNVHSINTASSTETKNDGGIKFGARVATLSSNGQANAVQRSSFGPGSRPRTFGARVASLPKSSGG